MTDDERAFDDTTPGRVTKLEFEVGSLKTQVAEGFASINNTLKVMQERQQPNFNLYAALLPSALVIIGGCWWIVSSNIGQPLNEKVAAQSTQISALNDAVTKVANATAASSIADASSAKDREDIHATQGRMFDLLNTEVTARSSEHAENVADKREYETQLKMVSNTINMISAEWEQKYALLWEDAHPNRHYPVTVPFRPQLFNPNPQSETR